MTKRTALIAGSTGFVGNILLHKLSESGLYDEVISIVRKPAKTSLPNVKEEIVDFDKLEEYEYLFKVNDIYICLGTTIKKAKTQEAFKKVDVDYPVKIAQLSAKFGAEKLSVISAMGANSKSKIFYNRMKGIMEQGVLESGIKTINIYRPSLLLGKRNEFRFGEKFASIFVRPIIFLFAGPYKKYRPVKAEIVAQTMLNNCFENISGINIFENNKFF
ncbi:MAG TPA: NAD(P)H-binding protein [Bacteroidales bacterium]|nr:NAD(P)H-binding protein [Bacteroidales bacterium]